MAKNLDNNAFKSLCSLDFFVWDEQNVSKQLHWVFRFARQIFLKISTKFHWKFQVIYNRWFLKHFKLRWFPLYANWRKHLFFTILLVSPCVWMINLTLTLWLVWISLGSLTVEHTSEGQTQAERPLRLQNYSIVASLQCAMAWLRL